MNTINEYRKKLGLTYAEFARRTGIERASAWKHCNGVTKPGIRSLALYEKAGLSIADILRGISVEEETIPHREARAISKNTEEMDYGDNGQTGSH